MRERIIADIFVLGSVFLGAMAVDGRSGDCFYDFV